MSKLKHQRAFIQSVLLGFTLIELMITVAVIAIALVIAVPNFTTLLISNRLSNTANDVIGAINLARMEAIKRNTPTQFCSNVAALNVNGGTDILGSACANAGSVYTMDANGITSEILRAPQTSTTISLTASNNITAIRFAGNGIANIPTGSGPYSGLVTDVFSSNVSTNNHRCIYLITGSIVSSCRVTAAAGGCPATEPASCQQ